MISSVPVLLILIIVNKDHCSWTDGNKCSFYQGYGEGSSYSGYWIKEKAYLDENLHEEDNVQITVGCVTNETRLFFTQKADGIMGLHKAAGTIHKPIYYQLYK